MNAEELQRLAAAADRDAQPGNFSNGLAAWRRARELLPPNSHQFAAVSVKLSDLSRRADPAATGMAPQ